MAVALVQFANQSIVATLLKSGNQLLIAVLGNISSFFKEQACKVEKKVFGRLWNFQDRHISFSNAPEIEWRFAHDQHKKSAEDQRQAH